MKYRRRQSNFAIKLICIGITLLVTFNFLVLYKFLDSKINGRKKQIIKSEGGYDANINTIPITQNVFHSRKLLNTSITTHPPKPTEQNIGDYPEDAFTVKQKKDGWIVLHCIGVLYMFLALAIICDEFFVPALHVISSILKISDDVAGATFMAAGGSAPELFTSIIGVFFSDSQVGFGTIVGSAVFNVLFVIGMCAVFSKTLLELTWWPLLRDSIFYVIALVLLIVFFSDSAISWHEALGLFLVYIVYVAFMVKNSTIEVAVKSYLSKKARASSVTPVIGEKNGVSFLALPTVLSKDSFRNGAIQLVIHTLDPIAEVGVDDKFQKLKDHYDAVSIETSKDISTSFLEDDVAKDTLHSPNQSETTFLPDYATGENSATFHKNKEKQRIEEYEMKEHAQSTETASGHSQKQQQHEDGLELDNDHQGDTNHQNFTRPDSAGSLCNDGSSNGDVNQNRNEVNRNVVIAELSRRNSVKFSARRLSRCSSRASSRSHRGLAPVKRDSSTLEEIKNHEEGSNADEEDEEEGPIDLSWPNTTGERIFYVIKAPLLYIMFFTTPDVRRPRFRKFFPLTFALSIFWIAVFSYLMLWWASEIGRAAGIDVEIMGLTIIAAGTSIPDLITSVVVARQGLGDMAVSSSIGSNIFDVTVGLPLPWFAFSVSQSFKDVNVKNSGLFCSTILLFLMLVTVVITIAANKWRMTKLLGGAMFGLYVVFITLTLLLQLNVFGCPFE